MYTYVHALLPWDLSNNSSPSGKLNCIWSYSEISWSLKAQLILWPKDQHDGTLKRCHGTNETWPTSILSCLLLSRNTNSLLQAMKITAEIETFCCQCWYRTCQCYSLQSLCCFWRQGGCRTSDLDFNLIYLTIRCQICTSAYRESPLSVSKQTVDRNWLEGFRATKHKTSLPTLLHSFEVSLTFNLPISLLLLFVTAAD